MLKNAVPSEMFLAAIKRGYEVESRKVRGVPCSAIWNRVCEECIRMPRGFEAMFAWDESQAKSINRIGTIQECIERGLAPGLRLVEEAGRLLVVGC